MTLYGTPGFRLKGDDGGVFFVAGEVIRSAIGVAKIFCGSTGRNAALTCSTAYVEKYGQARLWSIHVAELAP